MIPLPTFSGKTVAVLGLGRSGGAAARALAAAGARVFAWDDAEDRRGGATQHDLPLTDLSAADWNDISALVLSPGIPLTHPAPHPVVASAQAANCPVIGDMELFALSGLPNPVVAVTGTNGKSTTTALIGHLLEAAGRDCLVGGNIGKAVLDLPVLERDGVYVLEMSSYQLDLTRTLRPLVALLLNIAPDHLERHGTMQRYVEIKAGIFSRQETGDTAVIGLDDDFCSEISVKLRARSASHPSPRVVPVSLLCPVHGGVFVGNGVLYDAIDGDATVVADLTAIETLPGAHNWQNAAAAYATVRALGVDGAIAAPALATFPGLAHRQELVATLDGLQFVNDSKATNTDATARALACYERIYWIAGGQAKAGGIAALAEFFPRVQKAYLIGEAADEFAGTLEGQVDFEKSGTLEAAVAGAARDARNDERGAVLLSPAAASFDQFADFEARGEAFRVQVQNLIEEAGS